MQVITEKAIEAVLLTRFLRMGVETERATSLQRGLDLQRTAWETTSRSRGGWQGCNSIAGSEKAPFQDEHRTSFMIGLRESISDVLSENTG